MDLNSLSMSWCLVMSVARIHLQVGEKKNEAGGDGGA